MGLGSMISVERGQKRSRTQDWIISHTQEGLPLIASRGPLIGIPRRTCTTSLKEILRFDVFHSQSQHQSRKTFSVPSFYSLPSFHVGGAQ